MSDEFALSKEPLIERRKNHIWITGEIDEKMVHEFQKHLLDVQAYAGRLEDSYTPITIHITSDGGEAFAGFAIYDLLKAYNGEVTTIIEGKANSAGSIILMAGRYRYVRPSGFMLIHDAQGGFYGRSKDIKDFAKIMQYIRNRMTEIYRNASGQSYEKIDKLLDAESWLNAQDVVDHNFAQLLTTL